MTHHALIQANNPRAYRPDLNPIGVLTERPELNPWNTDDHELNEDNDHCMTFVSSVRARRGLLMKNSRNWSTAQVVKALPVYRPVRKGYIIEHFDL